MATVVECSRGALFETIWVPLAAFKAVRLGNRRIQRCPVHRKWEIVRRIDPLTLSDEQRAEAGRYPAGRIP